MTKKYIYYKNIKINNKTRKIYIKKKSKKLYIKYKNKMTNLKKYIKMKKQKQKQKQKRVGGSQEKKMKVLQRREAQRNKSKLVSDSVTFHNVRNPGALSIIKKKSKFPIQRSSFKY
tara:strand:- start:22 stop:369 length:348 start_codon:yes stop_codon:yes gene_type:complete